MEVKNNNAVVTVAIPFYNADQFLSAAIQSVINQTYQNWKLILLDDGSTDGSLEIANSYQNTDSRIEVISDGKNYNLGYRLNQIPHLTDTEFLARMDADDIMHPDRIEKQLEILTTNPLIDVLGTNAYSMGEDGKVVGIRYKIFDTPKLMKVNSFIHPTIMAKTDWFRKNPYDVKAVRIEDAELWMRTRNSSNFTVISEPLLYYREFGNKYYKKYFKGIKSLKYVIIKHKFSSEILKFSLKYVFSSIRSLLYYLVNSEEKMIIKRNQIIFKKNEMLHRSKMQN